MSTFQTLRHRYESFDDHRFSWLAKALLGFGLLAVLPFLTRLTVLGFHVASLLSMQVLVVTLVFAVSAQAWNIMSGYTGQFSFGHAAFFGIGAYATQKLLIDFTVNPWMGMLVGGGVAALYGLLIGYLCFRYELSGHYFALATLAFAELARFVVTNMSELNGANGYFKPFADEYASGYGLLAFQFNTDLPYYYIILAFLVVVTAVSWAIKRSWIGLYFFAIREDEQAAASVGVPAFSYKLLGIGISAFFTAWAGAFWSMYFNTIRPNTVFALYKNVELLLPAIIGGPATVVGPIVGSFVVTPVSEIARISFDNVNGLDRILYGIFLVVIVIYSPGGVIQWPNRIRDVVNRRTSGTDQEDT